jgi:ubiquinone/menaquinone biosynthesis C-methylase UbiE
MQRSQATSLIQSAPIARLRLHSAHEVSVWADLGCGTGTFTLALAALLPTPGIIYAVDKNASTLQQIPDRAGNTVLEKINNDFVNDALPFINLHGILMANALHYVKDKSALLKKLQNYLIENGCFLIVEYETSFANPWVPYPIRFDKLKELFTEVGFPIVEKIGEMPSRYQGKMYAALAVV